MKFTSLAKRLGVAGLLLALALAPSCSKSKSNPVALKELSSGNIAPNGTYQHTFSAAGTYPYHCSIHSVMTGTVVVDPASTNMNLAVSIVSATSGGFSPASVTVKTGGTVTWTNNHSVTHTVTSN